MKKSLFYIASSPTYGKDHFIKIGISDNTERRLSSLKRYDHLLQMTAVFFVENGYYVPALECAIISRFYKQAYVRHDGRRLGKEFFRGDPRDFIEYANVQLKKSGENYRRVL